MDFSGVPWNDRNDALSCNSIEFSISEDIDLWPLNIPPTVSRKSRSHRENSDLLAAMSFSNVSISSVSCATLALSSEMLVSSVEILTLSAAICSSVVI